MKNHSNKWQNCNTYSCHSRYLCLYIYLITYRMVEQHNISEKVKAYLDRKLADCRTELIKRKRKQIVISCNGDLTQKEYLEILKDFNY